MLPAAWMPKCRMERIIVHWSAGTHEVSALDREHYHVIADKNGKLHRGDKPISGNARQGRKGARASHTLNCNTGSIGLAMACMGGAIESPFKAGKWPMTKPQWDGMIAAAVDLCRFYGIKPSPTTLLSHAEVQANLGIRQRGKWDITRLAWNPKVVGAKACGDLMRAQVAALLSPVGRIASLINAPADDEPEEEDGGEPGEPALDPADDGDDAQPVAPDGEAQDFENEHTVALVQGWLRNLGYVEVGQPDGKLGPYTRGAIRDYRAEHDLTPGDGIDQELITALSLDRTPRKPPDGREAVTEKQVAEKVPEAKQTLRAKLLAYWTAGTAWLASLFAGVSDYVEPIKPYTRWIRNAASDVPGWFWLVLGAGLLTFVGYLAAQALRSTTEAFKQGARR